MPDLTAEEREEQERTAKLKKLIREAVAEEIAEQIAAAKTNKKKHWTELV